jgi:hypothetical protein
MRWKATGFGSIEIDGVVYEHDVVVDRGKIRRRRKKLSKAFRGRFGHTPLSLAEDIPWRCDRLIVGTGVEGGLPAARRAPGPPHSRSGFEARPGGSRYQRDRPRDLLSIWGRRPRKAISGRTPR